MALRIVKISLIAMLALVIAGVITAGAVHYMRDRALHRRLNYYRGLVAELRAGKLKPDRKGDLYLPAPQPYRTANGHVYVLRTRPGDWIVFFPDFAETSDVVFGGRVGVVRWTQIGGYLYGDKRLSGDRWFELPRSQEPGIHVEAVCTWSQPPVRPHWYYAEPFMSD